MVPAQLLFGHDSILIGVQFTNEMEQNLMNLRSDQFRELIVTEIEERLEINLMQCLVRIDAAVLQDSLKFELKYCGHLATFAFKELALFNSKQKFEIPD